MGMKIEHTDNSPYISVCPFACDSPGGRTFRAGLVGRFACCVAHSGFVAPDVAGGRLDGLERPDVAGCRIWSAGWVIHDVHVG